MFRMSPAALLPLRRFAPLLLATAALTGLVACGGSTSRVESFDPSRLVVFGDELSVIGNGGTAALQGYTEPAGAKYTVNALDDAGTALNCSSSLIWVQVLASNYDLPLGPCKGSDETQRGWIAAQAGARVADVAAQVAAFQDAPLVADTLVTVVAGLHDILDAYDAVVAGSKTRDEALADVAAVGTQLGKMVTGLNTSTEGPRILYATLPDLGQSPLAVKAEAAFPGEGRAALLSELTEAFNTQLRLSVTNDGRFYGLVNGGDLATTMIKYPSRYSLTNVVDTLCDRSKYSSSTLALPERFQLLGCTTATLLDAAAGSISTYFWADDIHPGPNWQSRFGSAAVSRTKTNPF